MDEQILKDFAETVKRAQTEIEKYGAVTAETSAQLDRQQQIQAAVLKRSQATSIVFGTLGSAAADLTKSLYSGAEGAQVFSKSLKIVTDAGGDLVSSLSALIKNPVWRGVVFALGQISKFAGNFIQETSKVSDDLYASFYKLADSGLATQEGMTGFASRLLEMNYGLNEMDKAVAVLTRDTQGLATFGGSVENGAKALGQFASSMRTSPVYKEMYRLYGNYDTINKKLVDYISTQGRLGAGTTASIAEFQKMTLQTEAMSRAFGVQTEQLDKINRKNRLETAFRAVTDEIREKYGKVAAENIENQVSMLEAKGYEAYSQATKAALAGNVNDPELLKMLKLVPDYMQRVQEEVRTSGSVLKSVQHAAQVQNKFSKENAALAKSSAQTYDETFTSLGQTRNLVAEGNLEGRQKEQADAIKKQIKEGLDPATEGQINMRHAQNNARDSLQQLVKLGINPVNDAFGRLGKTINKITGEAVDTSGADLSAGPGASVDEHGAPKARGGTYGTSSSGGTGGFKFNKEGLLGKFENFVTQGQGFRANYGQGVDDVIKFDNAGTGSRKHFDQLNDTVREAFINMAIEYNALTGGKKLSVNSAFRSAEEQEKTDSGGRPKAKPGQSLHQKGLAIDINTAEAQFLKQQGLLDRYGFLNDIAGDAPHIYMKPPGDKKPGEYADGGISDGPASGYTALLHGLEAIVPLGNNRSIPVSFREPDLKNLPSDISLGQGLPEINEAINRQSQVMEQQLQKSEAMIQALNQFASAEAMRAVVEKLQNLNDKMSTTNDINSRILQVQM